MNYEKAISDLEKRVAQLEQLALKTDRESHRHTSEIDDTSNKVVQITPYTETKTAYYGESKKTFYDVPDGNLNVYFTNYDGNYSVSRMSGNLTIGFDTLTEQTDITISIQ